MLYVYNILNFMHAKTLDFDTRQQEVARFGKLISHPARVAIIQLLAEKKSCFSGDIANEIPLNRATVSQHLQELKDAGIIKGEISGNKVCYCLEADEFNRMKNLLTVFFAETIINDNTCGC